MPAPTAPTKHTEIPALGLGTWQLSDKQAYDAVTIALEEGYRHVDIAQLYDNEWAVGRAIADSDVPRDDIFLTTKVDPTNRTRAAIEASVTESLSKLGGGTRPNHAPVTGEDGPTDARSACPRRASRLSVAEFRERTTPVRAARRRRRPVRSEVQGGRTPPTRDRGLETTL